MTAALKFVFSISYVILDPRKFTTEPTFFAESIKSLNVTRALCSWPFKPYASHASLVVAAPY